MNNPFDKYDSKIVKDISEIVANGDEFVNSNIVLKLLEYNDNQNRLTAFTNRPLTKKYLAEYLGISRPTLQAYMDNPDKITVGMIKKLSLLN